MKLRLQFSLKACFLLWTALSIAVVAGHRTYHFVFPPKFVSLGSYVGEDVLTRDHIRNTLARNGIECDEALQVRADLVARSLQLIAASIESESPSILISTSRSGERIFIGNEADSFEREFEASYDDILAGEESQYTAFLRVVGKDSATHPKNGGALVYRIGGCRRRFRGADGSLQVGYDVRVKIETFDEKFQVAEEDGRLVGWKNGWWLTFLPP